MTQPTPTLTHRVTPAQPAAAERRMADAVRALALDAVEAARSGHPGLPLRMADAAAALWTRQLRFDAADPRWPDRDRFVLSAGHGAPLLYALVAALPVPRIETGTTGLVVAGLLVGIGTRYGSGCTSGHGVCGLSRLSPRSAVATAAFMAAGFATVFVGRHLIT